MYHSNNHTFKQKFSLLNYNNPPIQWIWLPRTNSNLYSISTSKFGPPN